MLGAVAKKTDRAVTDAARVKWNESCWKMTVYIGLVAAALGVALREPWFYDQQQFWAGSTTFPLNLPVKVGVCVVVLLFVVCACARVDVHACVCEAGSALQRVFRGDARARS